MAASSSLSISLLPRQSQEESLSFIVVFGRRGLATAFECFNDSRSDKSNFAGKADECGWIHMKCKEYIMKMERACCCVGSIDQGTKKTGLSLMMPAMPKQ